MDNSIISYLLIVAPLLFVRGGVWRILGRRKKWIVYGVISTPSWASASASGRFGSKRDQ